MHPEPGVWVGAILHDFHDFQHDATCGVASRNDDSFHIRVEVENCLAQCVPFHVFGNLSPIEDSQVLPLHHIE